MARIDYIGGCKVAWEVFDNEEEAKACAERAAKERDRKFGLGYDFGYQWPGSISHRENHPKYGIDVWTVVVP